MRFPFRAHCLRGFSLIELSVVIVIVSMVAVMGLESVGVYVNRSAVRVSRDKLLAIDQALRNYYLVTGRLPCPALRTLAESDANYGTENCTATWITPAASNRVTAFGIVSPGSGYDVAPTYSLSPVVATPATATITPTYRPVTSISISSGGSGYLVPPTVTIGTCGGTCSAPCSGNGGGAAATATISSGAVSSVTITSNGSGYNSPPCVVFGYPPGGFINAARSASDVANIDYIAGPPVQNGGTISAITITNAGSGYTSAPQMTIYGSRSAATRASTVTGMSAVLTGAVPITELGLPLSAGIDGFGSKINYMVTHGLTNAVTFGATPGNIEVRTGQLNQPCDSSSTVCQKLADPTLIRANVTFGSPGTGASGYATGDPVTGAITGITITTNGNGYNCPTPTAYGSTNLAPSVFITGGGGNNAVAAVSNTSGSGTSNCSITAATIIPSSTGSYPCPTCSGGTGYYYSTSGAAFALFSSGPDKRGAASRGGALAVPCLPDNTYNNRIDSQNCSAASGSTAQNAIKTAIGATAIIPENVVYDSRYNSGNQPANYDDDILIWRTKGQL